MQQEQGGCPSRAAQRTQGGGGSGAPLAKAGGGRDARDARGGGPVRVCGGGGIGGMWAAIWRSWAGGSRPALK
jgi:hypothetical protein